ncbi:hypothetical protein [Streptomyces vilmorinianum]|uniref:hypothetical protein n=1 Tax=Streptomyces vilmorinianum TaxID=3051092 RepID=UPI0010FB4BAE|nr:hypothetical protein [Streptomyces vilmorinianum]
MTTTAGAAGWAEAVRERLRLGRLLPLGEAADGAWLAERAARTVLLRTAAAVRGVVPGALRVGLAEPGGEVPGGEVPFPVPPGGLPPGTLRITAEFAADSAWLRDRPLPDLADDVREALFASAEDALGLAVAEVDLRVTGLVEGAEGAPDSSAAAAPRGGTTPAPGDPTALAVLEVEGVAALTATLGAPVHRAPGLLRVELAVAPGHRALDVARAARTRAAATAPEGTAVTVLVSEVR